MLRFFYSLLCCALLPASSAGNFFPTENSILNYRIIGFSFSPVQNCTQYTLEVSNSTCTSKVAFDSSKILSVACDNKCIAEVPFFNACYTWHIIYHRAGEKDSVGDFHHFKTGSIPEIDTNRRIRILKKATKYKDAYVFIDHYKTLYDMNGKPVWYLPTQESTNANVRDLKLSPQGTITYVIDEKGIYEIDYMGKHLFTNLPDSYGNDDSIDHYHHEFTRQNNGAYMALAQDFAYWHNDKNNEVKYYTRRQIADSDSTNFSRSPMFSLVELNAEGHKLWTWKSSAHCNNTNLFTRNRAGSMMHIMGHENSFFFDENKKSVYVSARNLNRIFKISYPDGKLLQVYGNCNALMGSKLAEADAFFCGQHSCRISSKGYLYMYDNNTCNPGKPPKIVVFKESNGTLQKIWEYVCPADSVSAKGFPSGGNVLELPDGSYFVSDAFPDSKLFIVNKKKQLLWEAVAEEKSPPGGWGMVNIYRASIITNRKKLEQLIWNSEKEQ